MRWETVGGSRAASARSSKLHGWLYAVQKGNAASGSGFDIRYHPAAVSSSDIKSKTTLDS
jgi:hypothetical protein